ncbi:hypothetical protein [Ramlibacter rhizophilus]|uniref:Uncharacterized protein n=1 Tax=Ramlibacter rhizophilus TaxID=1781167 RepID=A0A4Z0BEP1_9BURK|nr:hypothetical protein [Ramlibacter rhizophilus]TFY96564.1 hypothetical protein EZ242_21320 [Ramlibacter rhizophilus]
MQASSSMHRSPGLAPRGPGRERKQSAADRSGGSPSLMEREGFHAAHEGAQEASQAAFALLRQRRAQALACPAKTARAAMLARAATGRTASTGRTSMSPGLLSPASIEGRLTGSGGSDRKVLPTPRPVKPISLVGSTALAPGPSPETADRPRVSIAALLHARADGVCNEELATVAQALVEAESRGADEAFFADLGAALMEHVGVRLASRAEAAELISGALRALESQGGQIGGLIRGACVAAVRSWHEDELGESFAPTGADLLLDRIEALFTALGKAKMSAPSLAQLLACLEDLGAFLPDESPGLPPELHERLGARIGRLLGGRRLPARLRQQVLAHVLSPRRPLDETRRSHELFGVLVACEAWDWAVAEHQALMKAIATAGLPADAVGALAWSLGLNCLCRSPEEAGWLKHGDHLVLDSQADPQAVFTAVLRRAAHLEDTRVVERLVEGLHTVAEMLGAGAPETDSPVRALRAAMRACAPASAAPKRLEALAQALVRADSRGEAAGEVARFCALEWDD